jgi:hypothetical protein
MKPAYKCTVELHVRAFFGARKFIILKIACESSGCGSLAILSFVLSVRLHVKKKSSPDRRSKEKGGSYRLLVGVMIYYLLWRSIVNMSTTGGAKAMYGATGAATAWHQLLFSAEMMYY